MHQPPSDEAFRPDVVAGKYDAALFDPDGEVLLVNEVFYSLQGEGGNAGEAAVFVRLAKCNLACKFCDTEFETYRKTRVEDVVAQVLALAPENPLTPAGPTTHTPWVILTGGEPLLQNCTILVDALHSQGFRVAVETSGSVWAPWVRHVDHVCVSPKVPLKRIPIELLDLATEVKWVVNAAFLSMLEKDPSQVWAHGPINYLQPESQNPKWTAAACKLIMAQPWKYRLSLQTHKYANLP